MSFRVKEPKYVISEIFLAVGVATIEGWLEAPIGQVRIELWQNNEHNLIHFHVEVTPLAS